MRTLDQTFVILIGDVDGIPWQNMESALDETGAIIIYGYDTSFATTAAGALELSLQKTIINLTSQYGGNNIIVISGTYEEEPLDILAESVGVGDPTFSGALSAYSLHLPTYHIFESVIKNQCNGTNWDTYIASYETAFTNCADLISTGEECRDSFSYDFFGGEDYPGNNLPEASNINVSSKRYSFLNVRKFLTKLIKFNKPINSEHDTFINHMYPVGSRYYTTTNINPGTFLGGTWVNKRAHDFRLKNQYFYHGVATNTQPSFFTWDTSYVTMTSQHAIQIITFDSAIYVKGHFYSGKQSNATDIIIGTINLDAIGVGDHWSFFGGNAWGDGRNSLGMLHTNNLGQLKIVNWVCNRSTYSTNTTYDIGFSAMFTLGAWNVNEKGRLYYIWERTV